MGRSRETFLGAVSRSLSSLVVVDQAYGQPVDNVGVGRVTGATGILFVTSSIDEDGVLQRSYST